MIYDCLSICGQVQSPTHLRPYRLTFVPGRYDGGQRRGGPDVTQHTHRQGDPRPALSHALRRLLQQQ